MPFKSQAQRGFMYAKHPEIAKRWEKHTPKDAHLPKHVGEAEKEACCNHAANTAIEAYAAQISKDVRDIHEDHAGTLPDECLRLAKQCADLAKKQPFGRSIEHNILQAAAAKLTEAANAIRAIDKAADDCEDGVTYNKPASDW